MFTILMLNKDRRQSTRRRDQSGMVSILLVSVLAVILGLISVGFSHLMDRELQQASDRELAAQAYYSAESGLNDARSYLTSSLVSFNGCATPSGATQFVSNGDLSNGVGVAKYSCVSINTTPNELVYALQAGQSVTFSVSQPQLGKLFFGWENQSYPDGPQPLGNLGSLPREDQVAPDATGVLRVGLYPVPTTVPGSVTNTNDYLAYLSRTYYMYPNGGNGTPGSVSYSGGTNGSFVAGNCNVSRPEPINNPSATPRYCNSVITDLQQDASSSTYYVRLTAEYAPLNVSVQATNGGSDDNPLNFNGSQGVVDITGTGTDVLQRVQARLDLSNQYNDPSYGLQSMVAICKGFRVPVTSLGEYGTQVFIDQLINNSDGACASPNGGGSIGSGGGDFPPITGDPCPPPYTGNVPNCSFNCPPNSHSTGGVNCECNSGYTGTPPNCVPVPVKPNCNVNVSGYRTDPNHVVVSAQASGCQYYYNNVVGWNGGGTWGPIAEPPGFTFCQQGGADPWGLYAEKCIWL